MAGINIKIHEIIMLTVVFILAFQDASGFDCEIIGASVSCPTLLNSNDKKFCCQAETAGISTNYCCDIQQFLQMQWVIFTMVGISLGILLGCCLCGCCCYRRRTRGAVYGRVQAVIVEQPNQTPVASPYPVFNYEPQILQQYPVNVHQVPPLYGTRATEQYAQQAPYNPNHYC